MITSLLLASLLLCVSAVLSPVDARDDDWRALRAPVVGLVIEGRDGVQRLRAGDVVLAEGDAERVQRTLVDVLVERHGDGRVQLALPTLGGTQFWGDVRLDGGWRIQRHVLTGHHRLLDPDDVRRAWGTGPACRAALERRRLHGEIGPPAEHLVLLLHGLGRSRRAMAGLAKRLRDEGHAATTVAYPSTRADIAAHADGLNALLDGLDGVSRVSFVTHSLGGIVVRAALADRSDRATPAFGRVVMIAPPSRGSSLARSLQDVSLFDAVMGPSGGELAVQDLDGLPPPPVPFGIVAAGRGTDDGANPLVPGDDDGVVGVEETALPGAADTLFVIGLHTFVMDDPEVAAATSHFLRTGCFAPDATPP